MKKIYLVLIGIFLIGIVFAGGIVLNKIISVPEKPTGISGELTFKIDGKNYVCNLNEPDGFIDENDIISCARKNNESINIEGKEITDITDWNGNYFKDDGTWVK